MSVHLEHEPLHGLARRVVRLAEETQHAAQVLERRLEALEHRTGVADRAERILSIAVSMRTHLGQDELSTDDLYGPDTVLPCQESAARSSTSCRFAG
ncbi:hypothetical protein [Streptosporangium longisporum]|uniref:ANTAR domain-containing protein n=1 Tax=Streptosporangium longisporum TaxID=46187 RepID=A0ABN3XT58_9ACTN